MQNLQRGLSMGLCSMATASALSATGCEFSVADQPLPSPSSPTDDIQYFAPDLKFKLSREAAAQKASRAEQELNGRS